MEKLATIDGLMTKRMNSAGLAHPWGLIKPANSFASRRSAHLRNIEPACVNIGLLVFFDHSKMKRVKMQRVFETAAPRAGERKTNFSLCTKTQF